MPRTLLGICYRKSRRVILIAPCSSMRIPKSLHSVSGCLRTWSDSEHTDPVALAALLLSVQKLRFPRGVNPSCSRRRHLYGLTNASLTCSMVQHVLADQV